MKNMKNLLHNTSRRSEDGHKPDLFDLVDYVESTGSTKLCLLHHLFNRSFFSTVVSKNDTLNGECLQNVPSLRFEPDPVDLCAMFFAHRLHHNPNYYIVEKHRAHILSFRKNRSATKS